MIATAFATLFVLQQPASAIVWETPAPEPAVETPAPAPQHNVPDWGVADPFGFERARCNPVIRGNKPLEVCQAEVRTQLALALGDNLPDALRPVGMADNCQMRRNEADGSAYAVLCATPPRPAIASPTPQEMDCRSRPDRGGGFTSECRPVNAPDEKGVSIKLWGND
nr:hypothetical protein [uncultured Brevundimonas sp.]